MFKKFNSKITRYIISGLIAAAVDFTLLFILVDIFHVWYLASATIAFIATVCTSFVLQKFWTFEDPSRDIIKQQMAGYLVLSVINIGVNTGLMYVFVDLLTYNYIVAQLCATIIIATYGFFVYRHLIFRKI